jgi:hypothetical protein
MNNATNAETARTDSHMIALMDEAQAAWNAGDHERSEALSAEYARLHREERIASGLLTRPWALSL